MLGNAKLQSGARLLRPKQPGKFSHHLHDAVIGRGPLPGRGITMFSGPNRHPSICFAPPGWSSVSDAGFCLESEDSPKHRTCHAPLRRCRLRCLRRSTWSSSTHLPDTELVRRLLKDVQGLQARPLCRPAPKLLHHFGSWRIRNCGGETCRSPLRQKGNGGICKRASPSHSATR